MRLQKLSKILKVMAKVNNKNYTLKNVDEFFKDINYEVGISQYQNTAHLLDDLHAPNVEVIIY